MITHSAPSYASTRRPRVDAQPASWIGAAQDSRQATRRLWNELGISVLLMLASAGALLLLFGR